jgi:hypothetical protein
LEEIRISARKELARGRDGMHALAIEEFGLVL